MAVAIPSGDAVPLSDSQTYEYLNHFVGEKGGVKVCLPGGKVKMIPPGGEDRPLMIYLVFPKKTSDNLGIGHFVATIDRGPGLDYFDPYGGGAVQNKIYHKKKIIKTSRMQMQRRGLNDNSCGEWCVLRLANHNLTDREFQEKYKGITDTQMANFVKQQQLKPYTGDPNPDEVQGPTSTPEAEKLPGVDYEETNGHITKSLSNFIQSRTASNNESNL